jgi:hypothetical protein
MTDECMGSIVEIICRRKSNYVKKILHQRRYVYPKCNMGYSGSGPMLPQRKPVG